MSAVETVHNGAAAGLVPDGRPAVKIAWLKRAYALLLALLGEAMSLVGSKKVSISLLKRSVTLLPNKSLYHRWLGECLLKDGQWSHAQKELCHALWQDSNNNKNISLLTSCVGHANDKEAIVSYYKALLRAAPKNNSLIEKGFGLAYLALHDDRSARKHLSKYWNKSHPKQTLYTVNAYDKKVKEDDLIASYLYWQRGITFETLLAKEEKSLNSKQVEKLRCAWKSEINASGGKLQLPGKLEIWRKLINEVTVDKAFKYAFANLQAEEQLQEEEDLRDFQGEFHGRGMPLLLKMPYSDSDTDVTACVAMLKEAYDEVNERYPKQFDADILGTIRQRLIHEKENKELNATLKQTIRGYRQRLKKLEAGKSILILGEVADKKDNGHAIAYLVTKEERGTYTFTIINTGWGTGRNHAAIREGGKKKIDPAYTIESIDADAMFKGPFLEKVAKTTLRLQNYRSISSFYRELVKCSKGKVLKSHRRFITPQRSGTCTWSVLLAVMRLLLPPEKYKRIIFVMKATMLITFYDCYKNQLPTDSKLQKLFLIAVAEYKTRLPKAEKYFGSQRFHALLSPEQWRRLNEITAQGDRKKF